jgi:hypothetical protein
VGERASQPAVEIFKRSADIFIKQKPKLVWDPDPRSCRQEIIAILIRILENLIRVFPIKK